MNPSTRRPSGHLRRLLATSRSPRPVATRHPRPGDGRREGTRSSRRWATAFALVVVALLPAACSGGAGDEAVEDGPNVLRVLAGSEIEDLEPLLRKAEQATGVKVALTYTGTLDGAEQVAGGRADGKHDAIWFSSNRYLSLIEGASARLSTQTKVMSSPVVLGLKTAKARELGWDAKPVTWSDIAAAAQEKKFTFGMTNPASSNSGFSALVGVTAALADSGEALDAAQIARVTPRLKTFFAAQTLTAGSSGWLADAYRRRDDVDGLINYESVLLGLKQSGADLTVIRPSDGVVTADYPLTLLASAADGKRDLYGKLTAWLRTPDVQREIMTTTNRRPIVPEVRPDQRFGAAELLELPFPNRRSAADQLIGAYLNEVRRPSQTVFVLDVSGSMEGDRIASLRASLAALTGADTSVTGTFSRFHNRERVTMIPFNGRPSTPVTFTVPERAPEGTLAEIRRFGDGLNAEGGTAIYDSLRQAYEEATRQRAADAVHTSVVLMTDGANTNGSDYLDFEDYYRSLGQTDIPTFVILFGDSDVEEMRQVAALTGGAVFDARSGSLAAAFKEIRGYQ
ncbi:VWA domain-containing protein [Thermopolyspora sp. NPDC052614]|uniref:vWA domain-containing protein n=1 Tax=Thermopolyspora sp. NPDC052614 TaxID=3155682 RepID=UPI003442B1FB